MRYETTVLILVGSAVAIYLLEASNPLQVDQQIKRYFLLCRRSHPLGAL